MNGCCVASGSRSKRNSCHGPERNDLHHLVDQLPEEELHAAERYLTYLKEQGDPLLRELLQAPLDDEPETEGERQALEEAYEDLAADRVYSLGDVRKDLGL